MQNLIPGSYIFPELDPVLDASSFMLQVSREKLSSHADFRLVREEGNIGIGAIRSVGQFLTTRPLVSSSKIVVIEQFHIATLQAQNAFLKTFEEPPSYAYIFLITPYIDRLLKTIVSRAQVIEKSKVKSQKSKVQFKIQNENALQSMSVGERMLWLEHLLKSKEKGSAIKADLLALVDELLADSMAKQNMRAIEYAKEIRWKIEQGFPNPKLLVEGLLVILN
ncbi:MAG: hypothetical protein HYZ69_03920 [Candidatus Colwellbacteria bacterium]|nr:hypothetical protein [Candidatus Colwellbacteria bacterium]